MTEEMDLPLGWEWAALKDLGSIVSGGTPKTANPANFDGDIPWITPADLTGYLRQTISRGRRNISKKGLESSSARIIPKGSVLFSSRAPIGYVAIAANDLTTNQGFKSVALGDEFESRFLYFYLKSAKSLAEKSASGTTFKEISGSRFAQLPIPVAPLNEQRRIVEKIETLFAQIDKGEEALREVQKLLARYRQSVLKAAVTGQLTADWRAENAHRLEHGRDLLARILQTRRETWQGRGKYKEPAAPDATDLPELPDGWVWVTLDHLLSEFITGPFGSALHKSDYIGNGTPLVNPINIVDGKIIPDPTKGLDDATLKRLQRFQLQRSDVVIARRGDMGRCAAVTEKEVGWLCGTGSMILRPNDSVLAKYLSASVRAHIVVSHLEANSVGTTMKNLNQRALLSAPIAIPSQEEQRAAMLAFEQVTDQIARLTAWCETELARSIALRQSILKDAFAGRLVPQDPDDEPAADLLARIRETRGSATMKTRRKARA